MDRVISAVFFDVGEIPVDESREYGTWADWLGLPRHTFSAVFGAVIARGLDYRETFQIFLPGFNLAEERERRAQAGHPDGFAEENLYPDARLCLTALREQGLRVGLAGNQTARAESIVRALTFDVDVIGTSDGWGVEKPSVAFFDRVVVEAGCPANQVLYVGDRLDNGVVASWQRVEAPRRPDVDGHAKWSYEIKVENPGRFPIDDIQIAWHLHCPPGGCDTTA
jgi:FMN phosphatase YigB (HAD superfamily)